MGKEFIHYEQALALKELGFNETCLGCYLVDKTKNGDKPHFRLFNENVHCQALAPLYQQAFRWFREKYNLELLIGKDDAGQYYFSVKKSEMLFDEDDYCFETYEDAELECLKKLIEITKNK